MSRRSLEVVSEELVTKNKRLQDDARLREAVLEHLRESVARLGLKDLPDDPDGSANPLFRLASSIPALVRDHLALTAELEQRVAQRTTALQEANHTLADTIYHLEKTQAKLLQAEKMAGLGVIVAAVAHELNTPVGNGVTVASTMQEKSVEVRSQVLAGSIKRSTLTDYVDTMVTASELLLKNLGRAHSLVHDFKQMAVEQHVESRQIFNLKHLLKDILTIEQSKAKASGIDLTLTADEDFELDSFPDALSKVLLGMIDNAIQHAFAGRTEGRITVSVDRIPLGVRIEVRDNGIGMPPDVAKRVFEPFFTTRLGKGGSGLGMAIAYNVVNAILGGSIEVRSELAAGTRFVTSVPIVAPGYCDLCVSLGGAGDMLLRGCHEEKCPKNLKLAVNLRV